MRAFMRVKIGGLMYRVVRVKRISGGKARGEIDFSTKTIRILAGVAFDVETECILHEITHGVFPNMGEQAVHTFSNRFYELLCDNPHFTKRFLRPHQK